MMFFTMMKSDRVLGPHIDHVKCEKCNKTGFHLHGKISYLVLELLNLPLMVIRRQYQFECSCGHCQQPCIKPKQLKSLKRQMLPWHYFVLKHLGMVLIMCIALLFYSQWQQHHRQELQLLAAPQVNDFYFVDYHALQPDSNPKFRYTVLKVVEVQDNTVHLLIGNIFKQRQGNVYSHVKADRPMINGFFSNKTITLERVKLAQYAQNGSIFAVRRPKNLSIEGSIVIPQPMPKQYRRPQINMDNQLGIALYRGEDGYYQDYAAAFEAFSRAAKDNDAAGQYNLAEMYRDGIGTLPDQAAALYWFKQAALQGHPKAATAYKALCGESCFEH